MKVLLLASFAESTHLEVLLEKRESLLKTLLEAAATECNRLDDRLIAQSAVLLELESLLNALLFAESAEWQSRRAEIRFLNALLMAESTA